MYTTATANMLSDEERQEDEMLAIENICSPNEFHWKKNTGIKCSFSISCDLINKKLLIDCKNNNQLYTHINLFEKLYIKYLPPVRLYIHLPQNYPSVSPPKYHIAINWLTPWEVSLICQKLDELWKENEFNEILFIWLEFLKNELLSYLHINNSLKIYYLMDLHKNPSDAFLLEMLQWIDSRVVYGGIFLNPIKKLLDYNESKDLLEFESHFHECDICLCTNAGNLCIKINQCNHAFCKNCILQYLTIKIMERNVYTIKCPAYNCRVNIKRNQINSVCSIDMFQKYEQYLLESYIQKQRDLMLVYCPRKICSAAVIVKAGENLASCSACEYNFCAYCLKVFHGVAACIMDSKKRHTLMEEYKKADYITQQLLIKKYGKQQIRQIVEEQLTTDYLQQNTKTCPTCGVLVAKITGCNLMTCLHCYTYFCWLCNSKITSKNEYEHFTPTTNGPCSGRLYEGLDESINDFDPEIDNGFLIVPNWNMDMLLQMTH